MAKLVRLPISLDDDARARGNEERNRRLFEWAATVLEHLGLVGAVREATTIEELRNITLNVEDAEVSLAIRDALHPATGDRQEHFHGLHEGALKKVLKNRFADLKTDREKVLRRHAGAKQRDWTDELILNEDGKIVPNLANLILILRKAPKWEGVLAYDEFNARVVIRRHPPWARSLKIEPLLSARISAFAGCGHGGLHALGGSGPLPASRAAKKIGVEARHADPPAIGYRHSRMGDD